MLLKPRNNQSSSIRPFLRRELDSLANDFTHLEPVGDNLYRGVLKNGHRVLLTLSDNHAQPDMTQVGAIMEIFRAQATPRTKWEVPQVLWEYTTPVLLVQVWRKHPTLSDIAAGRGRGVVKKYVVRYLLSWFINQVGVSGHFLSQPHKDDLYVAPGNRVGGNNFLLTGFLEPPERRIFLALLFVLLKGERMLAAKIILAGHYRRLKHLHNHRVGLHLSRSSRRSLANELESILTEAEEGGIALPESLIQAGRALYCWEKIITTLDPETDFNGSLLSVMPAEIKKVSARQAAAAVF